MGTIITNLRGLYTKSTQIRLNGTISDKMIIEYSILIKRNRKKKTIGRIVRYFTTKNKVTGRTIT